MAQSLADVAGRAPDRLAMIHRGRRTTFRQLDARCDRYAHGLRRRGVRRGDRALMMIRPGREFVALAYALFRIGAVPVFVDPGHGCKALAQCVAEAAPAVFIGMPFAHVLRFVLPRFRIALTPAACWSHESARVETEQTQDAEEAAIAFTSGSTGVPKGVVYDHGVFRAMLRHMREDLGIKDGEIGLPGLHVITLFHPALGVTSVLPDGPIRPLIGEHGVTHAFGAPSVWRGLGPLPGVRIIIAGAPVPNRLIDELRCEVLVAYGATEALPVTSIRGAEARAATGTGFCVGRALHDVEVRVIAEGGGLSQALPVGEVGEVIAKGDVVTRRYLRDDQTNRAKIRDGDDTWHRMGDLGSLDAEGRLWFCGRVAHRVGDLYPVCCESRFNEVPGVGRTAVVGVDGRPVLVVEGRSAPPALRPIAAEYGITEILCHPRLPLDIRHGAKIRREVLAEWAACRL